MDEIKEQNAVIESVSLLIEDHGTLSAWVYVDYGGSGQGFGGYALYLPKSFTHHSISGVAGHWIFRVMEIAGVTNWKDLPGKAIRVRGSHNGIVAIGHIVKNDWFEPDKDFKAAKEDSHG